MALFEPLIHPIRSVRRALGYADFATLPAAINFAGEVHETRDITFLTDMTWIDADGNRHLDQEIFDSILALVAKARRLILLDMFLFNDRLQVDGTTPRPLSQELTDALVERKRKCPGIDIYFITDPCNTVYGGLECTYFDQLEAAGIPVIVTDIDKLRDSNPIYTFLWRLFARPFGNSHGGLLANPFGGGGRISVRSFLQIANMKANHRKTLVVDHGDDWVGLVTTANPHDASYAHRNVAIRFSGPAVRDLLETEKSVFELSDLPPPAIDISPRAQSADTTLQVLTERKIKQAVLQAIDTTSRYDRLDLVLFYLADRDVLRALNHAAKRGVQIRLVLDPNKDAFGWSKSGIPNRPVAHRLVKRGMAVRWADTRGEQCHSKMLHAHFQDGHNLLVLGSANFTRRNLENFNLETDVRIAGPAHAEVMQAANDMFEAIWTNRDGRTFTVDYGVYREKSLLQHWLYWFMEKTGISTF